jgi:hypothetical protein
VSKLRLSLATLAFATTLAVGCNANDANQYLVPIALALSELLPILRRIWPGMPGGILDAVAAILAALVRGGAARPGAGALIALALAGAPGCAAAGVARVDSCAAAVVGLASPAYQLATAIAAAALSCQQGPPNPDAHPDGGSP